MGPKPELQSDLKKEKPPKKEHYLIQGELIKEFCKIVGMEDETERNVCVSEWIDKYAGNFDQLDKSLINRFLAETDSQKKHQILEEIQKSLVELNRING